DFRKSVLIILTYYPRLIFKNKYLKKESVSVELVPFVAHRRHSVESSMMPTGRPIRMQEHMSMLRTAPSSERLSRSCQAC
uniref:Uncharacterized protein n=1 Tax=Cyclopterus lumpus TaxID=8103 RepID=A0A8C2ZD21_CYCLU